MLVLRWGRRLILVVGASVLLLSVGLGFNDRVSRDTLDELKHLPERLMTRFSAPSPGEVQALSEQERSAIRQLGRRVQAKIVWSSNRDGQHELYLVDLNSLHLRRLTDNPHVDFSSRFSPDGTQIVFVRSQREWVSFREDAAWDVYLINADGTGEHLLVRGGYHPTWTADGSGVIFQRQQKVYRVDVASNRETLLFEPDEDFPSFGDIELSADGERLVMSVSGYGALICDLTTGERIRLNVGQACQTTWAPGDEYLLWMEAEGIGGTRVMRGAPDGTGRDVFIDLPGAYSHEYFPKVSNDGRWLIWGAAAEGHEHDRADYEIFLWEVGTPFSDAVRVTYYTGNDQWPDIYVESP